MIEFAWLWAFALLPLPLLVRYLLPRAAARTAVLRVPSLSPFRSHSAQPLGTRARLALGALAWAALIIAVAKPQWVQEQTYIPRSGRDLMLALDISASMQAKDFVINNQRVTRLSAAKNVASDFVLKRQGDRVGIIVYASRPSLQMPLSFDVEAAREFLDATFIGLVPEKNTAVGDAIGFTLKHLLTNDKEINKVLILLTDGRNNAGVLTPAEAAKLANGENMKIYTIGMGTRGGLQGIDERTLKMIAKETGGRYFYAKDTAQLSRVYNHIDQLETIEHDPELFYTVTALFMWPLLLASFIAIVLLMTARGA